MPLIEDIFWIVIMCGLLTFALCFMKAMRCHKLRVRDPYDRARYVTDYLMSEKKDKKSGVVWWVSVPWQKKIKMPEPPNEVVDVGKKGKKFCEVYRKSDCEFVFIKDKGFDPESDVAKGFVPFSTVQRQVIVSQFAKAEEARNKNFWKENALNLTAMLVLAMVIIFGIAYWGEFASFALEKDAASTSLLKDARMMILDLKVAGGDVVAETNTGIFKSDEEPPTK